MCHNRKIINWSGYEWITEERWGNMHPDKAYCWYDSCCVAVCDDNTLQLWVDYHPNDIVVDGVEYRPNYGTGLLSSTQNNPEFKYGRYTWEAKFPKGKNLWPAIWMWAWQSWPPEIDVVEAWTNSCGGYLGCFSRDALLYWDLTTNLHDPNAEHNMAEHWRLCKNLKNPADNFMEYALEWTPESLKFVYGGKCVRIIDDTELMKYLNGHTEGGMNIIMNNHPTEKYASLSPSEPLLVRSFRYEK